MSQERPKTASALLPEALSLRPALRRFLSRRLPPAEVDDVLQDVFVSLAKSQSCSAVENAHAYLFRVATNAVAAHGRRKFSASELDLDNLAEAGGEGFGAERILMSRQELEAVQRDILALPERTRDVFMLHRFEELSYPEIAATLGVSVSAVEKHMMKALRRLLDAAKQR